MKKLALCCGNGSFFVILITVELKNGGYKNGYELPEKSKRNYG